MIRIPFLQTSRQTFAPPRASKSTRDAFVTQLFLAVAMNVETLADLGETFQLSKNPQTRLTPNIIRWIYVYITGDIKTKLVHCNVATPAGIFWFEVRCFIH